MSPPHLFLSGYQNCVSLKQYSLAGVMATKLNPVHDPFSLGCIRAAHQQQVRDIFGIQLLVSGFAQHVSNSPFVSYHYQVAETATACMKIRPRNGKILGEPSPPAAPFQLASCVSFQEPPSQGRHVIGVIRLLLHYQICHRLRCRYRRYWDRRWRPAPGQEWSG